MVVTTIGRVRERDPDADFLIMSYMPSADRALIDDPTVQVVDARPAAVALVHFPMAFLCWMLRLLRIRLPDSALPPSVRSLRGCRALFDVSGISFNDSRLAVVAYNVLCVLPAVLLEVPVVRLSQAMGPFRHPLNRYPARWLTARTFHTFARGRLTAEHIRGLGVPGDSWSVAADTAFAYRSVYSLTEENEHRVDVVRDHLRLVRSKGVRVAAVVPSSVVLKRSREQGGDYLGLLVELVSDLLRRGFHVLVLPNATRSGVDQPRNNDLVVIEQLRARLEEDVRAETPAVSWIDHDLNTAAIRSLLELSELVITSRFHAMVAALALETPALVIGWSHKYAEVLEMFDAAEWAVDHASAAEKLLPLLGRMLDDIDRTSERIRGSLPEITASAKAQFEVLDRLPDVGP